MWAVLSTVFLLFMCAHLAIFLHECGHLAAACYLGRELHGLEFGAGPGLTLNLFGVRVALGVFPTGGAVLVYSYAQMAPYDALLFSLAGPVATVCGILGSLVALCVTGWPIWVMFFVVNVLALFGCAGFPQSDFTVARQAWRERP